MGGQDGSEVPTLGAGTPCLSETEATQDGGTPIASPQHSASTGLGASNYRGRPLMLGRRKAQRKAPEVQAKGRT